MSRGDAIIQRLPDAGAGHFADPTTARNEQPDLDPVLSEMLTELYSHYTVQSSHFKLPDRMRSCLCRMFPNVKMGVFYGAFLHSQDICSTLIAVWLISNGFTEPFSGLINGENRIKGANNPIRAIARRGRGLESIDRNLQKRPDIYEGFSKFMRVMSHLSEQHPDLLEGIKLKTAVRAPAPVRVPQQQTITCVFCSINVQVTGNGVRFNRICPPCMTKMLQTFPECDLDEVIARFGSVNVESAPPPQEQPVAAKKKRKPRSKKARQNKKQLAAPAAAERLEDEPDFSDDSDLTELLCIEMLKELYSHYKVDPAKAKAGHPLDPLTCAHLSHVFSLPVYLFEIIYSSNYDITSTLIAAWFISNGFAQQLKELFQKAKHGKWINDLPKLEQIDFFLFPTLDTARYPSLGQFTQILLNLAEKYPQFLDEDWSLPKVTIHNKMNRNVKMFECLVCFTAFSGARKVLCGNEGDPGPRHAVCRDCLRGHASATVQEMPLAEGAVGLRCVDLECKHPIYYHNVRYLIPKNVRQRLDERIADENLAESGVLLERCRDCSFVGEMEQPVEKNSVFDCPQCGAHWCRVCDRKWDQRHFGYSCKQLDQRDKDKGKLHSKIDQIVVRKCHKCGLQFVKSEGCNLMHCRCGAIQCYLCKQEIVNSYDHFCQHQIHDGGQCTECNACCLFQDAEKLDNEQIERIRREAMP